MTSRGDRNSPRKFDPTTPTLIDEEEGESWARPPLYRSFSPNMLRLTEDIGNLLEDDDFAMELPLRGDDWAGSYVFEERQKASMPSPRAPQQPKPRREEGIFEFGKTRDERASPRLLNFGAGAFAPAAPTPQAGNFLRPVASRDGITGPLMGPPGLPAAQSQIFGSFQSFEAYRPPRPMDFPTAARSHTPEMQATAREFVPAEERYIYPRSTPSPQYWGNYQMSPVEMVYNAEGGNVESGYFRGDQRGKRETKRGKRGKKKTRPGSRRGKGKGDGKQDGRDSSLDDPLNAGDDPNDSKRAELVESPATRMIFKEFYRNYRHEERSSSQNAEEYALQALNNGSLPESVHWRVYLELADLAKRSNRYVEARRRFQKVMQLQPHASQGWLEYSKLEEECGNMNRVTNILHAGLDYCEHNEALLTRAVKHQEKLGNLEAARGLLSPLKHVSIDKVWRAILEGALVEARSGNQGMARRVLKYLMHHVPWYGPLYLEAYKLERFLGNPVEALHIVERGLHTIPRYGPLWFGAFRICEEMDNTNGRFDLPRTLQMVERATSCISKELVWKVHLEAAQILERAAYEKSQLVAGADVEDLLHVARCRMGLTVCTCPNNLRWKVWMAAGRMELGLGNVDVARALFVRALRCVQDKSRSISFLDCARLEEFKGDTDLARALLCKARVSYGDDWKVWLESCLLEMRNGNLSRAVELVSSALETFQGTGRLWSTLVQLSSLTGGDEGQLSALRQALNAVPKSGEVWCEGGRVYLNPFSTVFDIDHARRHLYFASKFTPQFGDSFIELIRLEILHQWLSPTAELVWERTKTEYLGKDGSAVDRLSAYLQIVSTVVFAAKNASVDQVVLEYRDVVTTVRKNLKPEALRYAIDLSDLRLNCSNADPNYGTLWFQCRRVSTNSSGRVVEDAAKDVADGVQCYAHLYLVAMLRSLAVLSGIKEEKPDDKGLEAPGSEILEWETRAEKLLGEAPSLKTILKDQTTGAGLLLQTIDGTDFATALTQLKRPLDVMGMPFLERRKALFGTDALFP